jgi:hypothetical protein
MSVQHMEFMYIGTAPCGCITGMSWDDEDAKKSNALFVAKMIRRGDAVARVERFEGDSLPVHECEKNAAERAERAAKRKATGSAS